MYVSAEKTVGEIAAAYPAAPKVLEKHHIDYYGERSNPFREACRVAGVSAEEVLEEMRTASRASEDNWNTAPLSSLIAHLVDTHRSWIKQALPSIDQLVERAAPAGEDGQSIPALARVFQRMRLDLEQHLRNEEKVLFPAILEIEKAAIGDAEGESASGGRRHSFGSVRNPIKMIEQDHEIDTRLWDELRELAYGYVAGADAPRSIRTLYRELAQLEQAVHEHTHLENNVLFPRVIRLVQGGARKEGNTVRALQATQG